MLPDPVEVTPIVVIKILFLMLATDRSNQYIYSLMVKSILHFALRFSIVQVPLPSTSVREIIVPP